jgi:uncharacterized protein (DUF1330 family)
MTPCLHPVGGQQHDVRALFQPHQLRSLLVSQHNLQGNSHPGFSAPYPSRAEHYTRSCNMKSAYVIAHISLRGIDSPAQARGPLAEYFASAPKSVADFGGEFVVRNGRSQILEGKDHFSRCIVLKFPNYETAINWYKSDEYTRLKKMRSEYADMDIFLIEAE